MSLNCQLFETPIALNYASLFFSTVAQQIVGMFWYGLAFSSVYCYYFAADKGVKRVEFAIRRYGLSWQILGSLITNFVRSFAIATTISLLGKESSDINMYLQVALAVGTVTLLPISGDFWADRPLPLIIINSGNIVALALTSAVVLFYTRDINWFAASEL
eukprot:GDKK01024838.1.p1 GENE.GDKK01024838.1~~GDKK01024838.1.p1  ORF type:complete len:160 (-),score=6.60 GDKK01024838.1:104-583(-)